MGQKRITRPPAPRLDTLHKVRRELAHLYREGKAGRMDVATASRLAHILALIARILEGAQLEDRVAELEKRQL